MTVRHAIRTKLARALVGTLVVAGSLGLAANGADASAARPQASQLAAARPGTLLYRDDAVAIYGCASYEPTAFGWLWHVILTTSKPAGVSPAFVNASIITWSGEEHRAPTSDQWWGDVVNAVDLWAVSRGDFLNWTTQVWVVTYVGSAMVGNLDSC